MPMVPRVPFDSPLDPAAPTAELDIRRVVADNLEHVRYRVSCPHGMSIRRSAFSPRLLAALADLAPHAHRDAEQHILRDLFVAHHLTYRCECARDLVKRYLTVQPPSRFRAE